MAYGVPVIASGVGGIPEVVEHGKTGMLAPPRDVDLMARYALELLTDREKYKKMSKQGIERAKKYFCGSKIVPLYVSYYQRILEQSMNP